MTSDQVEQLLGDGWLIEDVRECPAMADVVGEPAWEASALMDDGAGDAREMTVWVTRDRVLGDVGGWV